MNSILSQAKKEWQEFKRDKLSLSLALVLPIFALVLFGYGIKLESSKIAAVFLDYDNTKLSRKLIDSIQSTTMFKTVKEAKTSKNDEYYELKRNQARLKVVIPKGFARKILREEESFYDMPRSRRSD